MKKILIMMLFALFVLSFFSTGALASYSNYYDHSNYNRLPHYERYWGHQNTRYVVYHEVHFYPVRYNIMYHQPYIVYNQPYVVHHQLNCDSYGMGHSCSDSPIARYQQY